MATMAASMDRMTLAGALSRAASAIRASKKKGDRARPVAAPGIMAPTDEQRGLFTARPVTVRTEAGMPAGRAYRREPYYETLAKLALDAKDPKGRRLLGDDQLRAVRIYRDAWESSQASETRCALAVDDIGGGTPGSRIPAGIWTDARVRACDQAMGADGATLRAVVLHDQSFSAVAIQRWGSRQRQRVVGSKVTEEIVPKSSAHAVAIREEFLTALASLTGAMHA